MSQPDFSRQVKAEKLELLFRHSGPATFIILANGGLILYLLWNEVHTAVLIGWLVWLLAAFVIRNVLYVQFYNAMETDGFDALKWEKPYSLALIFSSASWGIGGLILGMLAPTTERYVIYFFLMGMSAGAVSVYTANRRVALTTIWILLFPYTLWTLFLGEGHQLILALGASTFLFSSIRSTKIIADALQSSLTLSHDLAYSKTQVEALARIDPLTQLNTRIAFTELSETLINSCRRQGYPYAFLIVDVDHFKSVNDTYGHLVGDLALKSVANTLVHVLRHSDICGRFGGEEFIVFLPYTDFANAMLTAEKLRAAIQANQIELDGVTLRLTASFGVCSMDMTLEELVAKADEALYQAKRSGRNRVVGYPSMNVDEQAVTALT